MSERSRLLGLGDKALAAECEIDLYRASGAGGQKRNKTSSAVRMRHAATGLVVTAHESRSQAENRRDALRKLRTCIALDVREAPSESVEAMAEVASFIRKGPLRRSSRTRLTDVYLAFLASVLDILEAHDAGLASAAQAMGVSTARLGKLLRGEARLVRRVAEMRTRHGLKPLQ